MAKITIVVGHSLRDTFCKALGKAYQRGARSGGHETQLFVLSHMSFDPILREGYERVQPHEPDLKAAYDALKSSSHLVVIFPLWCGDMPAILKGFIERLVQPDLVAIQKSGKMGMHLGIFPNTSACVILTMGMPAFIYRYYFGAHALKLLRRNILHFIGIKPVRETIFGLIGNASAEKRAAWLREVEAMGREGR